MSACTNEAQAFERGELNEFEKFMTIMLMRGDYIDSYGAWIAFINNKCVRHNVAFMPIEDPARRCIRGMVATLPIEFHIGASHDCPESVTGRISHNECCLEIVNWAISIVTGTDPVLVELSQKQGYVNYAIVENGIRVKFRSTPKRPELEPGEVAPYTDSNCSTLSMLYFFYGFSLDPYFTEPFNALGDAMVGISQIIEMKSWIEANPKFKLFCKITGVMIAYSEPFITRFSRLYPTPASVENMNYKEFINMKKWYEMPRIETLIHYSEHDAYVSSLVASVNKTPRGDDVIKLFGNTFAIIHRLKYLNNGVEYLQKSDSEKNELRKVARAKMQKFEKENDIDSRVKRLKRETESD